MKAAVLTGYPLDFIDLFLSFISMGMERSALGLAESY